MEFQLGPTYELVLAGDFGHDPTRAALREVRRRFLPNKVLAGAKGQGDNPPALLTDLLAGKSTAGDEPTLYVCEGFTCREPVRGVTAIAAALEAETLVILTNVPGLLRDVEDEESLIDEIPQGQAEEDLCLLYTSDAAHDLLCVDLGG